MEKSSGSPPVEIARLSDEQKAQLSSYASGLTAIASAGKLDRQALGAAMELIFGHLQRTPPPTLWCSSPWQLVAATGVIVLNRCGGLELDALFDMAEEHPLWQRLVEDLRSQSHALAALPSVPFAGGPEDIEAGGALPTEGKSGSSGRSRDAYDDVLGRSLSGPIDLFFSRILAKCEETLSVKLGFQAQLAFRELLIERLRAGDRQLLAQRLDFDSRNFVRESPARELYAMLGAEAQERVLQCARSRIKRQVAFALPSKPLEGEALLESFFSGALSNVSRFSLGDGLAVYYFAMKELGLEVEQPLASQIEAVMNLRTLPLYAVFHEGLCLLCERPQYINLDQRGRLHDETGPAVSFADGFSLYASHGVAVPAWVIERPEDITVDGIDAESNAEVRRVLIERFGLERYLEESGAEELDRDECGVLYLKAQQADEPIVAVKVTDSTSIVEGSPRHYFLRVPPYMRTARQAVAWTFQLQQEEYRPAKET